MGLENHPHWYPLSPSGTQMPQQYGWLPLRPPQATETARSLPGTALAEAQSPLRRLRHTRAPPRSRPAGLGSLPTGRGGTGRSAALIGQSAPDAGSRYKCGRLSPCARRSRPESPRFPASTVLERNPVLDPHRPPPASSSLSPLQLRRSAAPASPLRLAPPPP